MRPAKRLKRWAVYQLARFSLWLLNRLPRSAAQAAGAWFGVAAWAVLPGDRHRIDRHLKLVYGEQLGRADRNLIGRQFFINSGKNLADFVRFKEHFDKDMMPAVEIDGLEHYRAAFSSGRGMFGVTGHIGNFELLAARMAREGYPLAVIGREMYDRRLDRLLVANREAVGLSNISTTDSPRKLLQWLKDGGGIGVLIDTDSIRVRGEFVTWFGRPAYTPIGQALIGLKADAAFVPMACVRIPGNRYQIIVRPEVKVHRTHSIEEDARCLTQACVRELEAIIDQYRSQWIWLHNRWHTRPEQKTP